MCCDCLSGLSGGVVSHWYYLVRISHLILNNNSPYYSQNLISSPTSFNPLNDLVGSHSFSVRLILINYSDSVAQNILSDTNESVRHVDSLSSMVSGLTVN